MDLYWIQCSDRNGNVSEYGLEPATTEREALILANLAADNWPFVELTLEMEHERDYIWINWPEDVRV